MNLFQIFKDKFSADNYGSRLDLRLFIWLAYKYVCLLGTYLQVIT